MNDNMEEELTCKPLDSYAEIMMFLKDPPPWSALCKELTPHSEYKINNMDINKQPEVYLDEPETFCHFNPDAEDPIRSEGKRLPKTLICHDMANGYHDDSVVDGTTERNAYTFYNWAGIDIFCYFSHHLITIPPVGWINVGHAHGVKVLGTVITEWSEGVEFWDEILGSETMFQNFAKALVSIAKILKFDGWLLNVENKISKPLLLIEFVQHLHCLLHDEIPNAELIWYDSVTIKGNLNWQNALNEKNRPFFDACDGIFTNYSWTEFDITTSAIEAGERITDLYIGIDVWGRNFYSGGKFNTQQAIKLVYEQGCSLAIFAPAWTHEAMSTEEGDPNSVAMAEDLDKGQLFLLRDRALWGSFWPFLSTRLPTQLPFKTSFCRGLGKKRRLYGEVICRSSWYNLRHQQYQPNSAHGPHGYLLSSEEAVLAFSKRGVFRDDGGAVRYRESFEASRIALHSRTSRMEPEPSNKEDDETEPQLILARALQRSPSDEPQAERRSSLRQQPTKRTIKDCLKGFFGTKAPKRVSMIEIGEKEAESTDKSEESSATMVARCEDWETAAAAERTAGSSMVTMSVNLRLGQGGAGPRARVSLAAVGRERECLEHHQEDSFVGGSCLRVHPADDVCRGRRYTRLFHCDFPVERAVVVCVVTKPTAQHPTQFLNVWLHAAAAGGAGARVLLLGRQLEPAAERGGWLAVAPLDPSERRFRELQRHLLLHETGFYVPVENDFGWRVSYFEVHLPGHRVTSLNVQAGEEVGAILLGHIGVCRGPAPARDRAHAQPR